MTGNLWEWTAEWYAAPGAKLELQTTWSNTNGAYGDDFTVNIASSAKVGDN